MDVREQNVTETFVYAVTQSRLDRGKTTKDSVNVFILRYTVKESTEVKKQIITETFCMMLRG